MKLPGILLRILLGVIALFVGTGGRRRAGSHQFWDRAAQPWMACTQQPADLSRHRRSGNALRLERLDSSLGALFFVNFGIAALNFLEAVVFLPPAREFWKALFSLAIITNGVACLLWMLIFRNRTAAPASAQSALRPRTRSQSVVRFLIADASTSSSTSPLEPSFFPGFAPSTPRNTCRRCLSLSCLQFFVRGPVQVSICLVLTIMLHREQ